MDKITKFYFFILLNMLALLLVFIPMIVYAQPVEDPTYKSVVNGGIIGLIIMALVVPIFKWLRSKIDEKDKYIRELVNTHMASDLEVKKKLFDIMGEIKTSVEKLPESTTSMIKKTYPVGTYKLQNKVAKKILKKSK